MEPYHKVKGAFHKKERETGTDRDRDSVPYSLDSGSLTCGAAKQGREEEVAYEAMVRSLDEGASAGIAPL